VQPADLGSVLHAQHPLPPWLGSSQVVGAGGQLSGAAPCSVFACRRQHRPAALPARQVGTYDVSQRVRLPDDGFARRRLRPGIRWGRAVGDASAPPASWVTDSQLSPAGPRPRGQRSLQGISRVLRWPRRPGQRAHRSRARTARHDHRPSTRPTVAHRPAPLTSSSSPKRVASPTCRPCTVIGSPTAASPTTPCRPAPWICLTLQTFRQLAGRRTRSP
jgi:hypothetical protein